MFFFLNEEVVLKFFQNNKNDFRVLCLSLIGVKMDQSTQVTAKANSCTYLPNFDFMDSVYVSNGLPILYSYRWAFQKKKYWKQNGTTYKWHLINRIHQICKGLFTGLASFQTIWSIISDQCRIPTRAGLVSTPLVYYQRPWSGIDTPGISLETIFFLVDIP